MTCSMKSTERMNKAIESLRHDFLHDPHRTRLACAGGGIKVDYYGMPTPLQQLATIIGA